MDEIQQVGHRWPQAFDAQCINALYGIGHRVKRVTAIARMQKSGKRALVFGMLVNIGDTQFGLPEKRMICSFEHLALLGNGFDCDLQRRAAIGIAKAPAVDFLDDQLNTAPDRAKVFQPLGPQKPCVVGAVWIESPALNQ